MIIAASAMELVANNVTRAVACPASSSMRAASCAYSNFETYGRCAHPCLQSRQGPRDHTAHGREDIPLQHASLDVQWFRHLSAPVLLSSAHDACCCGEYGLDNAPNSSWPQLTHILEAYRRLNDFIKHITTMRAHRAHLMTLTSVSSPDHLQTCHSCLQDTYDMTFIYIIKYYCPKSSIWSPLKLRVSSVVSLHSFNRSSYVRSLSSVMSLVALLCIFSSISIRLSWDVDSMPVYNILVQEGYAPNATSCGIFGRVIYSVLEPSVGFYGHVVTPRRFAPA